VVEQLRYNNRERLLDGGIPEILFQQVLDCARAENLLSDEHFSVDDTLIRAWASQASFAQRGARHGERIKKRSKTWQHWQSISRKIAPQKSARTKIVKPYTKSCEFQQTLIRKFTIYGLRGR
jgi:hypothetical protein